MSRRAIVRGAIVREGNCPGGQLSYTRGAHDSEVERRPHYHQVVSSNLGSGCQLWNCSLDYTIGAEYLCSSQEAESREKSLSCKNLFLNRYTFGLSQTSLGFYLPKGTSVSLKTQWEKEKIAHYEQLRCFLLVCRTFFHFHQI